MDFLSEARKAIEKEAAGIQLLAENIPARFTDAVELIFESTGRLIVSGIGKSGHIGRKIASTMASLGQRSFFMHPSEACHGDLGMIGDGDVLLLISYSGESVELLPIIDFAKRFGNKIISISRDADSRLVQNSDIPLILPDLCEACPLGVAPTVSSTVTLVLGDSLAIALLSKRGFTKEQFKEFHPGGAIGKKLSLTSDVMRVELPLIGIHEEMMSGIKTMSHFKLGCLGVIDESGRLVGMITDGDLRRNISGSLLSKRASDIMTSFPVTVEEGTPSSGVLHIMESKKITNAFVVNSNKYPIGIVHIHDLILRKLELG
jgi:arabinose-5-phosphate isomerase